MVEKGKSMDQRLKIGITHGDINGISYEVILKMLQDTRLLELFTPVVYGSAKVAGYYRKALNIESEPWNRIKHPSEAVDTDSTPYLINCTDDDIQVEMGKPTAAGGSAAYAALDEATTDLLNGDLDALVTAPINKSAMPYDLFPYKGHTAYLGARSNSEPLMILAAKNTRVALVTEHIALSDVVTEITSDLIVKKGIALRDALVQDLDIASPRIAVMSINPHAGDNGLIGEEENRIIAPAIARLRNEEGVFAFGPFAADGFWGSASRGNYDAILAMYHDQGLAPFKLLAMDEGVNFTAGLPFVRTSPAHGTGYDIVGKGIASERSLREACFMAIDIVRRRRANERLKKGALNQQ